MQETQVRSLGWEDNLEKEMATHSSILVWKVPHTEEPSRPQSMGSQRVWHYWATSLHFTSQVALVIKNPPANAGDVGSIPGLERSPGEGNGNPLQYPCLENSWRISWTEEPGGLWSIGSQRVGPNWSNLTHKVITISTTILKGKLVISFVNHVKHSSPTDSYKFPRDYFPSFPG